MDHSPKLQNSLSSINASNNAFNPVQKEKQKREKDILSSEK